jgi:predicted RNase H-like HicB family nuclease
MNYPVVIHKDADSDYGVTVPDLPGCFSAGRTLDEALARAREAIELHVEGLLDEGQPVPKPGTIERHQRNPDYRGGTWAVVSMEPSSLRLKAVRINVTVPERVLDAVDRFALEHGQTRSGLLVEAVTNYIGRGDDRALPRSPKQRRKAPRAKRKGR